MANKEQLTPEAVIRALQKAKGIKTKAAEYCDCTRWTIDNYCKKYPEVQRAYLEEREKLLDKGESKLIKYLDDDDNPKIQSSMVKFLLSTLGRDRGYGDRDVSLERLKEQLGDVTDLNLDALNKKELKMLRELIIKASKEAPQRTQPKAFLSNTMNAKPAIKEIRSMDRVSDVVKFVKGETRSSVKKAAKQRKNAIKKKNETDE